MYYNSLGVSIKDYGFIYSFYVFFEVVLLICLNYSKKKYNPELLLLVSSILSTIRVIVFYSTNKITVTIILTTIKGIINGLLLYMIYTYIINIVKKKNTTIVILFINLINTIYTAVGNNILGNLIEKKDIK